MGQHGARVVDRSRSGDGAQGFLHAFDGAGDELRDQIRDLGSRWEIVETGITVKLYPSCAGTHPTLDALLDLRRRERFTAMDVERVDVAVDSITPTVLIYDRPSSALEAKFSMPFCAAAAVVFGTVGVDTFASTALTDARVCAMMPRVTMRVDSSLDRIGPPLTEARVSVALRDGRLLRQDAHGARGYPDRPASDDELAVKFRACAQRALPDGPAERAYAVLVRSETMANVRVLTDALTVR